MVSVPRQPLRAAQHPKASGAHAQLKNPMSPQGRLAQTLHLGNKPLRTSASSAALVQLTSTSYHDRLYNGLEPQRASSGSPWRAAWHACSSQKCHTLTGFTVTPHLRERAAAALGEQRGARAQLAKVSHPNRAYSDPAPQRASRGSPRRVAWRARAALRRARTRPCAPSRARPTYTKKP